MLMFDFLVKNIGFLDVYYCVYLFLEEIDLLQGCLRV